MKKKLKQEVKKKVKVQTKNEELSKVKTPPKKRVYKFMNFPRNKKPEGKLSNYELCRLNSLRAEMKDLVKKIFE